MHARVTASTQRRSVLLHNTASMAGWPRVSYYTPVPLRRYNNNAAGGDATQSCHLDILQGSYGIVKLAYNEQDKNHYVRSLDTRTAALDTYLACRR